jgi:hypothetical protein
MQLGDEINEGYEFLTRVPGGWIYGIFVSNDTSATTCTFIPFNNEFKNLSECKCKEKQICNPSDCALNC